MVIDGGVTVTVIVIEDTVDIQIANPNSLGAQILDPDIENIVGSIEARVILGAF